MKQPIWQVSASRAYAKLDAARAIGLTLAAEADIADILDRSAEDFGPGARRRYETLIAVALEDLRSDPVRPASRDRPELGAGTRSYHLRHSRLRARAAASAVRAPRHFVIYEQRPDANLVVVLRVLHDAMDLARHFVEVEDEEDPDPS